jgi:spore coat polysaccharide biosynthesis protein SpsF (cytidylyltransferase family)
VLADIAGRPLLGHLIDRLRRAAVEQIIVATSAGVEDDPLAAFAAAQGVAVHRGPEDDVLARVLGAARAHRLDAVVRVCADSPLLDPALVDRCLAALRASGADMASNVVTRTYPPGQSVEALTAAALERAGALADEPADREHVTRVLYRRPDAFRVVAVTADPPRTAPHLAVDTAEDLALVRRLVAAMDRPPATYGLDEVLALWRP